MLMLPNTMPTLNPLRPDQIRRSRSRHTRPLPCTICLNQCTGEFECVLTPAHCSTAPATPCGIGRTWPDISCFADRPGPQFLAVIEFDRDEPRRVIPEPPANRFDPRRVIDKSDYFWKRKIQALATDYGSLQSAFPYASNICARANLPVPGSPTNIDNPSKSLEM